MNLANAKQKLTANNIALVHVVAFDNQYCIGKNNQLAWHIPEDLQHFKQITTGGVVVMGRKTFESIGKALPKRVNWVISRDNTWTADGVKVAHSLEHALTQAAKDVTASCQPNRLFIIGGAQIFEATLPIADLLYTTKVDLTVNGDVFYPDDLTNFRPIHQRYYISKGGVELKFIDYQRSNL